MLLVRHGQAEMPDEHGRIWSYSEVALSEAGHHRAAELTSSLAETHLDAVYSSDMRRARQTAEAIAMPRGLPVISDARLRELDIGEFEGMDIVRLQQTGRPFVPWLDIYF